MKLENGVSSGLKRSQWVLALLIAGIFGLLTGCGSSKSGPPTVTVFVTPSTSNIFIGKSQQFAASVFGSSNTAVTWSVAEANGGTVSATGNYTAPMTAGTYHVVASSVANPADSAAAPAVVTVPQPNFTSTPPTAATQDQPYSYALAATDPAGTAVTFTLTTAPDGATLSGNAIAWTPSAQQAREDNAFAVTATSVAGGTATQSWAVSPAGTVQGSLLIMHWSADGTVGIEDDALTNTSSYQWAALVPQSDGSLTVLPGTGYPGATWSIPGVPAGYYWMQFAPGDVIWTNDSAFDFGADNMGHLQLPITEQVFGCNLTGLDPFDPANDEVELFSVNAQSFAAVLEDQNPNDPPPAPFPATGSTVCDADPTLTFTSGDFSAIGGLPGISPSSGDIATTIQFETPPSGTLAAPFNIALVDGPALNQSLDIEGSFPFPFPTVVVPGALTSAAPQSQDFNITFSAWQTAFNAAGPTPGIPQLFEIDLNSQQQAPALPRTNPFLYGNAANVAFLAADSSSPWPQDASGNNVWPQDGDFGTLNFNNPFTTGMGVPYAIVYEITAMASYAIPFPNSTVPVQMLLQNTLSTLTAPTGFTPGLQPVGNPQVNGASLFTATTVPTVSPTLTWTAPTSSAPVIYSISICQPVSSGTSAGCNGTYYFGDYTQTTFTVPAGILTPGDSYIFSIEADSRTGYDPLHPNRYSLPEATAWLVSAAITVDSSAASGIVHGDRSLLAKKPGQTTLPVPGLPVAGSKIVGSPLAGSKAVAKQTHFVNSQPLFFVRPQEQQSEVPTAQPAAKK